MVRGGPCSAEGGGGCAPVAGDLFIAVRRLLSLLVPLFTATPVPAAAPVAIPDASTPISAPTNDASNSAAGLSVTDDFARTVSLKKPARRIVALSPHATELLYSAGAGKQLVAVVSHSDYPPQARKLPQVGSANALDFERLLALQPDLVVLWGSGSGGGTLQQLTRLGLKVFVSEPRSFEDVARNVRMLGILSGHAQSSARKAEVYLKALDNLRKRYAGSMPLRVFYQIWDKPLITINGEHLISQAIKLCGGVNVFAAQTSLVPKVGREAVIKADPQVILSGRLGRTSIEWHQAWLPWNGISAVREQQLYTVNADWVQRQALRTRQGAEQICMLLDQARKHYLGAH